MKYPYSRPSITEADIDTVTQVLRSGALLSQGPEITAFEEELASAVGCRHAIVCNSGTAALHLAYLAIGLGSGDTLLTAPVTFLATANAAVMCGADVAFCDVEKDTGILSVEAAESYLEQHGDRVKAIVPIHLAGRPADLVGLRALADKYGLRVVEDACHALGATYRDKEGAEHKIGACAHSDVAVFSFHAIKHLSMGEGGACCTNDDALAAQMRLVRNHGLTRDRNEWQFKPDEEAPWYYEMQTLGWNYRPSDILCALGRSQLTRLDWSIEQRDRIARFYFDNLDSLPATSLPPLPPNGTQHAWHLFPLRTDFAALGKTRSDIMLGLRERGIGTQVHYIPVSGQPYYKNGADAPLPNVEHYYARTLSIPMYPNLDENDLRVICDAIRDEFGKA